jgi:hypothetical protein
MNESAPRPGTVYFHRAAKTLVILFFALHTFNVEFTSSGDGIDPSWQYLINDAADRRQTFAFTCGPYGFIDYPLAVGDNLGIATVVRLLFWLGFTSLFAGWVWRAVFSWQNAGLLVGVLALVGPISYDYFLCFLGLFMLALALVVKPWRWLYGCVLALSTFLALMKLSAGLLMLSSCFVFTGLQLFKDPRKAIQACVLTFVGLPLWFCFFYLGYDPSLSGLCEYVRWSWEICSGYSVAMSLPGLRFHLWLALLAALMYLALLLRLYAIKEPSFKIAVLMLPSLFFAFKHGFVRPGEHSLHFFTWIPLLMGLVLLFTPFRRSTAWLALLLLWTLTTSLYMSNNTHIMSKLAGLDRLRGLRQTLNYGQSKATLKNAAQPALAAYVLPEQWRQIIGQHSVSVFPIEAAYAQVNPLNFQSFPVVQAYAAYTRDLDRLNAGFLTDLRSAPRYILTQWLAIDRRHVLMDVPATWLALFQWYDAQAQSDDPQLLCLLKRRSQPRFQQRVWLERKESPLNEPVEIPRSAHPIVMKLSLRLSFAGQLAKFFFRVPKVYLELTGPHGWRNHRIMPDTLGNELFINYLPLTHADFYALMSDQPWSSRVDRIKLKGEGLSYYQNRLQVEFYTIPDVSVRHPESSAKHDAPLD